MRWVIVAVGVALAVTLSVPATAADDPAVAGTPSASPGAGVTVTVTAEHPLLAVSCVSSKYCVAVGYDEAAYVGDGGPLAETWNGRAWSAAGLKLPAGALGGVLFGVSCKSLKSCIAIGSYLLPNDNFPESDDTGTLAESWNGKTWTAARPPTPAGATSAALSGVFCATAAVCVATGVYTRADGTSAGLAESWNGKKWTEVPVTLPTGSAGADLNGVSCASAKSCVAVGSYGNAVSGKVAALAESWNGKTWRVSKPPAPAGNLAATLEGVSCVSLTDCAAVGSYTLPSGYPIGLAESWNGKKWTEGPLPTSGGYGGLFAVSCVSSKYCLAVGNGGAAGASHGTPASYVWNGKGWSFKKVPVPLKGGGSTATSILQGSGCLSATDCVAVGQLDLGSAEQYQYGFSRFWNGKAWKPTATA
jgi:hypothetical protein